MCNKIENRFIFKIKTGYYLEHLTSGTMKLLGSIESKIAKGKNGEGWNFYYWSNKNYWGNINPL